MESSFGRPLLDELVTAAMELAGVGGLASHRNRLWRSVGGRTCPIGWSGCSQTVYIDEKTGEYDYGHPGGPGHADCVRHCRHGVHPADNDLLSDTEDALRGEGDK